MAKKNRKTKSETHVFLMILGRTDLIISQSRAKFCEESAGDVRFGIGLPKLDTNREKHLLVQSFCIFVVFQSFFLSAKRHTEMKL